MPVLISFDVINAGANEHGRIQSLFERLGWENLGGSSYRYPKLGAKQTTEDWFNHVLPALMLFRSYAMKSNTITLTKFTIDVQSSTGYGSKSNFGTPPQVGKDIKMYKPGNTSFGKKKLENWLDGIDYPY